MKITYSKPIIHISLLICLFLPCSAFSTTPILVSTSNGVYKVGKKQITDPVIQKLLSDGTKVDAFKTERLSNGKLLIAWGMGRTPIKQDYSIASLELVDGENYHDRKHIITTKGKRIRDFVVDGDNIVAVGHNNADIHIYSLATDKHVSKHITVYKDGIIHAIEMGDMDNDNKNEYYVTVTAPNVSGGLGQAGMLVRVDVDWDRFTINTTDILDAYDEYTSHIKEIGVADLNSDGVEELIVEVAPQIEVYSQTDLNYIEPMRLLSMTVVGGKYQTESLADAEIRLGRLLSIADIDKDGYKELFFVDYYQSGIYILENKKQKISASGSNVNELDNDWKLTRIDIQTGGTSQDPLPLKSNAALFFGEKNQLLVVSDGFKHLSNNGRIKKYDMSLNYFTIILNNNRYHLQLDDRRIFKYFGNIWHLTESKN